MDAAKQMVRIKQVPDADPNADGAWIDVALPAEMRGVGCRDLYDRLDRFCDPGHHCVQLERLK